MRVVYNVEYLDDAERVVEQRYYTSLKGLVAVEEEYLNFGISSLYKIFASKSTYHHPRKNWRIIKAIARGTGDIALISQKDDP